MAVDLMGESIIGVALILDSGYVSLTSSYFRELAKLALTVTACLLDGLREFDCNCCLLPRLVDENYLDRKFSFWRRAGCFEVCFTSLCHENFCYG